MSSLKLKIFNKLPKVIRTEIALRKMPHSFIVEATNVCNQRCPACPWHTVMTREKESLSFENFKKIFSKIERHAEFISFYLMGEPLLNREIFKMIKICEERGIKTLVSSNAMLVGGYINEILDSGLTTLQLTLDGFSSKTHEKYRVGSKFETVRDNIRKIAEEKKKRGLRHPILHIQTLLFEENKNEREKIENFAREIGINHYSTKIPTLSIGRSGRENTVDNNARFYKNKPFCSQLNQCVILVNGDIAPCCFDFNGSVKFGNIYKKNLKEIWQTKKRKIFIDNFFKKTNALCQRCDMMDERGKRIF